MTVFAILFAVGVGLAYAVACFCVIAVGIMVLNKIFGGA